MYEGKLRNGNGAYHDASTEFERKNVNQGASICPRRKKRGKQSNPTCIAMRHDKIISSTQIHAVCFFRLIAKADLSCFISRTGEGSTREAEKVEEEDGRGGRRKEKGKERKSKERNVRQPDSRPRIMTFPRERPCICISLCNRRGTFLGKREANDSLHIYLPSSRLRRTEENEWGRTGRDGKERVPPSRH